MRSNTPYEYLNSEGQVEEVYSPSNPQPVTIPSLYEVYVLLQYHDDHVMQCAFNMLSTTEVAMNMSAVYNAAKGKTYACSVTGEGNRNMCAVKVTGKSNIILHYRNDSISAAYYVSDVTLNEVNNHKIF